MYFVFRFFENYKQLRLMVGTTNFSTIFLHTTNKPMQAFTISLVESWNYNRSPMSKLKFMSLF